MPTRTAGDLEPSWSVVSSTETAARQVAVRDLREERTPDDHVVVSLELLNLSDADLSVQVRTAFHAGDLERAGGTPVTDAIWQRVRLPGQGSASYRAEAFRPGEATWQVEIRAP